MEERLEIMREFDKTMTRSGYSKLQRSKALEAGLVGYANKVERARSNNIPLHRSTTSSRGQRRLQKIVDKHNWFRKEVVKEDEPRRHGSGGEGRPSLRPSSNEVRQPPTTVLFAPRTRGGQLVSLMKQKEAELRGVSKMTIRIVEESGTTLKSQLTSSNPVKVPCQRPKCTTCPQGGKQLGKCFSKNLVYSSECIMCPEGDRRGHYIGETSRTLLERNGEHMDDQRSVNDNIRSHRREHLISMHPEVDPRDTSLFTIRVIKVHSSAMSRMVHESILVRQGEGVILNLKEEYSRTLMPCLRVEDSRGVIPQQVPHQDLHKVAVGLGSVRRPSSTPIQDQRPPPKRGKCPHPQPKTSQEKRNVTHPNRHKRPKRCCVRMNLERLQEEEDLMTMMEMKGQEMKMNKKRAQAQNQTIVRMTVEKYIIHPRKGMEKMIVTKRKR